jgi:hypothetical protein
MSKANNKAQTTMTTKDAVGTLESISIITSTPDETQALTNAYIRTMRTEILGIDGGANEELGARLDRMRGKAEGISEVLSEVKV